MISADHRKKVLIVESNDAMAENLQSRLQEIGFDARITWSGHEALALVQSSEFEVLLMDSYLPDLHTSDFLKRLSHLPLQPWVVVMKGRAGTESQRRYRALGVSTVVNKRDAARVIEAVSSCCEPEPLAKAGAH
jgi:CheY-like chemotaxis protein